MRVQVKRHKQDWLQLVFISDQTINVLIRDEEAAELAGRIIVECNAPLSTEVKRQKDMDICTTSSDQS